MPVTIQINGRTSLNSLVHKGSNHFANSTMPDVCKTPSPGGPVPVPYPIIVSLSSDLADGSTTVTADGGNMIAIKGCQFTRCTGDEAGTAGGVKSSTFMKEAKFISYSPDVRIDGQNACRLGDKMTMNHENTVCLSGAGGPPVMAEDFQIQEVIDVLCDKFCEEIENGWTSSYDFEQRLAEDEQCADLGLKFPPETGTTSDWGGDPIPETIPDCSLYNEEGQVVQTFDFKGPGDRWWDDQLWRQEQVSGRPPHEISEETCECPE